jgi:pyruvate kinase
MKPTTKSRIIRMIKTIDGIIDACHNYEENYKEDLSRVHPEYYYSAVNLVHYVAFRKQDTTELQQFLFNKGLSGLKNAEGHVMSSLLAAKKILYRLIKKKDFKKRKPAISIKKSEKLSRRNAKELFGNRSKKRSVRIMVTQPDSAATDPGLSLGMMQKGMNTIRINCAHDSSFEWLAMIEHARMAMKKTGKKAKITMDLGGPKIRTGVIEPGPKVAHLRPERNSLGQVTNPGRAGLLPEGQMFPDEENIYIPVPKNLIEQLGVGDLIMFKDTRDKKRHLKVVHLEGEVAWVNCYDTAYLQTGMELILEQEMSTYRIGEIPPLEQFLRLKKGDRLIIHKKVLPGEPAAYDEDGNLLKMAHVSCTSSEVFEYVKEGDVVVFDDGKIVGSILENTSEELLIDITYAKELGSKLKADKGINFPLSDLNISGLTNKDREDLKFVIKNADVANMSFVNQPGDVEELLNEIEKLGALNEIGVVLKIETMTGFRNIVKILLKAMRMKPIGVMIARGDLAIECGWENVGIVQEELLKICSAAHIPTVWATQVMENLAKKGVPSRAEITDAVMAQRADCVMLNKGMYILQAIELLNTILINMERVRKDKRYFFKQIVEHSERAPTNEAIELPEL